MLRRLRIAASVFFVIATLMVLHLWVRSYSWFDRVNMGHHWYTSLRGYVYIDESFGITGVNPANLQPYSKGQHSYMLFELGKTASATPQNVGWKVPYWLLLIGCLVSCGIHGLPWWSTRFSVRTMLVATTVLAIVLGAVVVASR